tara:strand:- start:2684 stop:3787 length:1104 start_codon:yes stop_codon:yes gene_type:complete
MIHKIAITLLILFTCSVNASALIDQQKHDPNVDWPTKEWSLNLNSFEKSEIFEEKIDFLFSESSYNQFGKTNALLVIQNGQIVFEQYNEPINTSTKLVSYSMAKSYTAALAGIMLDQGYFKSIQQNNLFPHWTDLRKEITIDDLLNMKSGLEFVEEYSTDGRSDTLEMIFGEGMLNQAKYASNFSLARLPGTHYSYSTGTTNILSMLIKNNLESRNIDYYNFIDENLLKKIGLKNTTLEFDKSNTFIGGSSVFASARDYAKFGYLYLRDGKWENHQVISKKWIDATRVPSNHTDGLYSNKFWHMSENRYNSFNFPKDTYYCAGFGGQYILIVPSQDIVMVRLGETYNTSSNKVLSFLGEIVREIPNE